MSDMFGSFIQAKSEIVGSKKGKVTVNKQYQKGRDFAHDITKAAVGSRHLRTRDDIRQDIMSSMVSRRKSDRG